MSSRGTKWLVLAGVLAIVAIFLSLRLYAQPAPNPAVSPSTSVALATSTPLLVSPSLAPVASAVPFLAATSTQPKITWSSTSIEVILSPGESSSSNLSFSSSGALNNVVIEAIPQIAGFLTIQPNTIPTLSANQQQPVQVVISVPTGTAFGTYDGTIHVRVGTTTFPQTVKVTLNVWQKTAS